MRKASREMKSDWALSVMRRAPYITVSFTRPDGTAYGLPLSLASTDDSTWYFHCAPVGEKLDPTGLVLTLAMSDGTTQTVAYSEENASDFAFDPETFEVAGATEPTAFAACSLVRPVISISIPKRWFFTADHPPLAWAAWGGTVLPGGGGDP